MEIDKEDNWEDFPEYFNAKILWNREKMGRFYYHAAFKGKKMSLRNNNFPEEPAQTLFVNDRPIINFNNWPPNWGREERRE